MTNRRIVGCSGFGLLDALSLPSEVMYSEEFNLSDALLPENPFGKILVGEEAAAERTHSGIYWPPEAKISEVDPIRRVPIPYAWRALVEAGDRSIRWKAKSGVSFSVPRILASHLAGLLNRQRFEGADTPVVVIPDHLDEYGQQALLDELTKAGYPEAILIWRPVAAALCWLEAVKGDFVPNKMEPDDHIHVLYFGPEAIEFTVLRLRVYKVPDRYFDLRYVLPLRDRAKRPLPFCTMDWAGCLIENVLETPDKGAFFQAFTSFPETWGALANEAPMTSRLLRPWSFFDHWTHWSPPSDLPNRSLKISPGPCNTLRRLFSKSCRLAEWQAGKDHSNWESLLHSQYTLLKGQFPDGRLRGLILCGPLAPKEIPSWLITELENLPNNSVSMPINPEEPEIDSVWIMPGENALAKGAALYGYKLQESKPTYLDTMPQVSILAQSRGQYQWIPLLKASEVMGGEIYQDIIEKKFQIQKGSRQLNAFIKKGQSDSIDETNSDETGAPDPVSFSIAECIARLIREVVRRAGSFDEVLKIPNLRHDSNVSRYAISFAKFLYSQPDKKLEEDLYEDDKLTDINAPFRKTGFIFPSAPDRDMPLDIAVRVKPACGLAQVEIIPEDTRFLRGRRVYLDYSNMRPSSKLPIRQRGWPRVLEMPVDPTDTILNQNKFLIERFENTSVDSVDYDDLLDDIKTLLDHLEPTYILGKEIKTRVIDQSGASCTSDGDEYIRRIAVKCQWDLFATKNKNKLHRLFVRASRLWGATPKPIVDYISTTIENTGDRRVWQWAVEAASRSFTTREKYKFFYKKIVEYYRANDGLRFPINSARSVCRLLMYRRDSCLALDRESAQLFAQGAVDRLMEEFKQRYFKEIFFRCVLLLLYLLRVRRADVGAFDPSSQKDLAPFHLAMELMTEAVKHAKRTHDHNRAVGIGRVISGLENYLEYEGDEGTISILTDFSKGI